MLSTSLQKTNCRSKGPEEETDYRGRCWQFLLHTLLRKLAHSEGPKHDVLLDSMLTEDKGEQSI